MFELAEVIASAIAEATIRGSVALIIAAILALAVRRRASVHSFLWHMAFAGVLCLTALSPVLPSWSPPLPESVARVERIAASLTPTWLSDDEAQVDATITEPTGAAKLLTEGRAPARPWRDFAVLMAVVLWACGVVWRVTRVVLESGWLRTVERNACALSLHGTTAFSTARGLSVMETGAAVVPMIWGFWRHRLLLPTSWRQWPAAVTDAVLRHEIAHLERRDLVAKACVEVVLTVFWFNPIVLIAARGAHIAREQACDDRALRSDMRPEQYAESLILLTRLLRDAAKRPRFVLAFGKSRELVARVHALLDDRRSRSVLARKQRVVGIAAGLALIAPLGVVRLAPARAASVAGQKEAAVGILGRALDSAFAPFGNGGFSGVILVSRSDTVIFRKAFGLADRARKVPMKVSTRFQVAGIMKAVTAAAIVDLVERDVVSLDAPVSRYLGELTGPAGEVSLRQLLLHTDGLRDVRRAVSSRAAFLRAVSNSLPVFSPGTSYLSTDVGHSVLAAVVERVVGQPFDDFIQERFLNKAGLSASAVGRHAFRNTEASAVGYANDRRERIPRAEDYEWGVRGSRGLQATADDLLRWYDALAEGDIIGHRATSRLFTPYHRTAKGFGQSFGWLIYDSTSVVSGRDTPILGRRRPGREVGFEAELVHDQGDGWTAVILANTDENTWRTRALDLVSTVMAARHSN